DPSALSAANAQPVAVIDTTSLPSSGSASSPSSAAAPPPPLLPQETTAHRMPVGQDAFGPFEKSGFEVYVAWCHCGYETAATASAVRRELPQTSNSRGSSTLRQTRRPRRIGVCWFVPIFIP